MDSQEDVPDALTLNLEGQDQQRTITRSAEAGCTRSFRKNLTINLPEFELNMTEMVELVMPLLLTL